ncbi:MAG: hypothetical protein V4717_15390 [Bacteroidota bacterium]
MKKSFIALVLVLALSNLVVAQNVGIGTTNPDFPLDIQMEPSGTVLGIRSLKDSIGAVTLLRFTTGSGVTAPTYRSAFVGNYRSSTGTNLIFGTGNAISGAAEKMRLSVLGNLGLNVELPLGRIHMDLGNTSSPEAMVIDNDQQESTIQFQQGATDKAYIQNIGDDIRMGTNPGNATGLLMFRTNGLTRGVFTGTGQFGIGTLVPEAKLHIIGGVDASLVTNGFVELGTSTAANLVLDNNEIQARTNGAASDLFLNYGGGGVRIGNGPFTSAHQLGVEGNAVITGNLRVGATSLPSGFSLGVDGKIICTEVMVRLVSNWPDYVFSDRYKLRSISNLEQYIQENKHLPGIPSATDLQTNGLTLGEMQKLQMEKIEELTLYLIQLKKDIGAMEQKLDRLKK